MKIFVCIDKSGGMLFNNRRLSQDSIVRQKMLEITGSSKLYLNSYSAKQFESSDKLIIDDNFLTTAAENDFCFIENLPVPDNADEYCAVATHQPTATAVFHILKAIQSPASPMQTTFLQLPKTALPDNSHQTTPQAANPSKRLLIIQPFPHIRASRILRSIITIPLSHRQNLIKQPTSNTASLTVLAVAPQL